MPETVVHASSDSSRGGSGMISASLAACQGCSSFAPSRYNYELGRSTTGMQHPSKTSMARGSRRNTMQCTGAVTALSPTSLSHVISAFQVVRRLRLGWCGGAAGGNCDREPYALTRVLLPWTLQDKTSALAAATVYRRIARCPQTYTHTVLNWHSEMEKLFAVSMKV